MREAFCLASGPSLTPADVEQVRQWRAAQQGRWVVAVNTTVRLAPWADALYAMDRQWWKVNAKEIEDFAGQRFGTSYMEDRRIQHLRRPEFDHFQNSGAGAVALAILKGATTVYLLGYDCKKSSAGKTHWHGDHPRPLTNAVTIGRWGRFFERLAGHAKAKGVRVLNCSRETALACFERARLEEVCGIDQQRAA